MFGTRPGVAPIAKGESSVCPPNQLRIMLVMLSIGFVHEGSLTHLRRAQQLTFLCPTARLQAMSEPPAWRQWEEPAEVLGRAFVLRFEGPTDGRFDVWIWEGKRRRAGSRPYLRAPIRGRDTEEARERALEVLHNYVGLDQFRLLAEEVAAEVAPGARVEIREDARQVIMTLAPPYALRQALAVPRSAILGPDTSESGLRVTIREHLEAQIVLTDR